MKPPHFVQSALLRSEGGFYHAFLGVDLAPGRGLRDRLREFFAVPPDAIGSLRQVHSATVVEMTAADMGNPDAGARAGDGLFTSAPGTGVGVRTADCAPILLAHAGARLAMAVHVGWRGLAAGIVRKAVDAAAARLGEKERGALVAAVGPAAKGCCYEVGADVCDLLLPRPGGTRHLRRAGAPGKWMADIQSLALEDLAASGIPAERCEAVGPCTVCSHLYHSFRREKTLTGRQLSFIYIL